MPNVRGDKRRTIVCPDDLWNALGEDAAENRTTRGAIVRDLIHDRVGDRLSESGEEPGEPA